LRKADDRPFEDRPGGLTTVSTETEGAASAREDLTDTVRVAGAPSAHEDLTEVVGPTDAASAQEDLKAITVGVKAINEQKARQREEMARVNEKSARTAGRSGSPLDERSPWIERTLLLVVGLVLGGVAVLALAQGKPPSSDQAAALTGFSKEDSLRLQKAMDKLAKFRQDCQTC